MRGTITGILLFLLSLSFSLLAQSPPQSISWQTVLRNLDGSLLKNQSVRVRFDLHQGTTAGIVVYSETHLGSTDEFGLLNFSIGTGTVLSGQFGDIDLSAGPYFSEVLVDPSGGTNYRTTNTQRLLSVPYALYAATSGSRNIDEVDDADADPANELQVLMIKSDTLFISDGNYLILPTRGGSAPHPCYDGLRNGDETGVDCGGPACRSCADRCSDGIQNGDETGVDCGGTRCRSCANRCADGIQNGDETGIDCGGSSCANCPAHCTDGILSGDETGIDCGGSSCTSCADRCSDGIRNGDEPYVDCGGSSCIACNDPNRCSDGIQNGDEMGIDCGGILCLPCDYSNRCADGIQNGDETGIDCGGSSCLPCRLPCSGLPNGQLTDPRDGRVYNTVQIGNQCWMAENLNYGAMINSNTAGSGHYDQTNNGIAEKYCYDNTVSNCEMYGGLYEWPELLNYASGSTSIPSGVQGLCPPGWHIPSDLEWSQLENYLIANGYNYDGINSGNQIAKAMASTSGWEVSSNTGAIGSNQASNNSSGFTALPGGYRSYSGNFSGAGNHGYFWSSSESGASDAFSRKMYYTHSLVHRQNISKQFGNACRCVRD